MARLEQINKNSKLVYLNSLTCCLAFVLGISCFFSVCRASETDDAMNIGIVTYEEVKDVPNHPYKYLIDVREPTEINETGKIPQSINIPLGIVSDELALNVDPEKFRKSYGVEKPNLDSYIIFTCRSGRRSGIAAEEAVKLGYRNIHNYAGSWLEWAKREGLE